MKFLGLVVIFLLIIGGIFYMTKYEKSAVDTEDSMKMEGEKIDISSFPNGEYAVVVSESALNWEGNKPLVPGYTDKGTIAIKEGSVVVSEDKITGGKVVIDMATIKPLSTGKGSGESMLEGHLKSADFFDVGKFPTAELVIKEVAPEDSVTSNFTVKGDLTIKGKTNPVEIPAMASVAENGKVSIHGSIKLDRTLWDVRYGSGKFFEDLADNVIDDFFTVTFDLKLQEKE
jgi:polyisoprenoid-binding protein YceI